MNLLVVDDNEDMLELYQKLFKKHQVDIAKNFDEAYNLLQQRQFEGIVLDFVLDESKPEAANGLDLGAILRVNNPEVVIAMVTGHPSKDIQEKVNQIGFNYYFEKGGNNLEKLVQVMEKIDDFTINYSEELIATTTSSLQGHKLTRSHLQDIEEAAKQHWFKLPENPSFNPAVVYASIIYTKVFGKTLSWNGNRTLQAEYEKRNLPLDLNSSGKLDSRLRKYVEKNASEISAEIKTRLGFLERRYCLTDRAIALAFLTFTQVCGLKIEYHKNPATSVYDSLMEQFGKKKEFS